MSSTSSRAPLIDVVKGLACLLIVAHHLAFYGPMSDIAEPLAPRLLAWLSSHGRMAVQVFLVLGGYLAAASLAPQGVARFASARQQVARRFARLIVPYAVALLVTVLVSTLVRPWLAHHSVPAEPDLAQLLANALLLQDILGYEALSAGVWYVAIDFQLFALAVLLFAAVRAWAGRSARVDAARWGQAAIVAGVAASLLVFNRLPQLDVWAVYFWGAYGLGMMAFWAAHAPRVRPWLLMMVALGVAALGVEFRPRIAVALAAALALAGAMRTPALRRWQGVPALNRIGQMSYSVFLLHFAVCLAVNAAVTTLWPDAPGWNALGMLLAVLLSLAAGRLMYERIEKQSISWPAILRWQAGLLGVGWLASFAGNFG